jgi:hypothetical protein
MRGRYTVETLLDKEEVDEGVTDFQGVMLVYLAC